MIAHVVTLDKSIPKRTFTKKDALRLGKKLKLDWGEVPFDQFLMGLNVEIEHNDVADSELDVAKIALAHLKEMDDYYTKLKIMEDESKVEKSFDPYAAYGHNCRCPARFTATCTDPRCPRKPNNPLAIMPGLLQKSRVKGHYRRTPSGGQAFVKEHYDKRTKKPDEIGSDRHMWAENEDAYTTDEGYWPIHNVYIPNEERNPVYQNTVDEYKGQQRPAVLGFSGSHLREEHGFWKKLTDSPPDDRYSALYVDDGVHRTTAAMQEGLKWVRATRNAGRMQFEGHAPIEEGSGPAPSSTAPMTDEEFENAKKILDDMKKKAESLTIFDLDPKDVRGQEGFIFDPEEHYAPVTFQLAPNHVSAFMQYKEWVWFGKDNQLHFGPKPTGDFDPKRCYANFLSGLWSAGHAFVGKDGGKYWEGAEEIRRLNRERFDKYRGENHDEATAVFNMGATMEHMFKQQQLIRLTKNFDKLRRLSPKVIREMDDSELSYERATALIAQDRLVSQVASEERKLEEQKRLGSPTHETEATLGTLRGRLDQYQDYFEFLRAQRFINEYSRSLRTDLGWRDKYRMHVPASEEDAPRPSVDVLSKNNLVMDRWNYVHRVIEHSDGTMSIGGEDYTHEKRGQFTFLCAPSDDLLNKKYNFESDFSTLSDLLSEGHELDDKEIKAAAERLTGFFNDCAREKCPELFMDTIYWALGGKNYEHYALPPITWVSEDRQSAFATRKGAYNYARGAVYAVMTSMLMKRLLPNKSMPTVTVGPIPTHLQQQWQDKWHINGIAYYTSGTGHMVLGPSGLKSFIHEFGHYIDDARPRRRADEHTYFQSSNELSPAGMLVSKVKADPDFAAFMKPYRDKNDGSANYYTVPTEIFARMVELYVDHKVEKSEVLKANFDRFKGRGWDEIVSKKTFGNKYEKMMDKMFKEMGMAKAIELLSHVVGVLGQLEEDPIEKSHIKGHWRQTPTGGKTWVRDHDDKRTKKPEEIGAQRPAQQPQQQEGFSHEDTLNLVDSEGGYHYPTFDWLHRHYYYWLFSRSDKDRNRVLGLTATERAKEFLKYKGFRSSTGQARALSDYITNAGTRDIGDHEWNTINDMKREDYPDAAAALAPVEGQAHELVSRYVRTPLGTKLQYGLKRGDTVYIGRATADTITGTYPADDTWSPVSASQKKSLLSHLGGRSRSAAEAAVVYRMEQNPDWFFHYGDMAQKRQQEQQSDERKRAEIMKKYSVDSAELTIGDHVENMLTGEIFRVTDIDDKGRPFGESTSFPNTGEVRLGLGVMNGMRKISHGMPPELSDKDVVSILLGQYGNKPKEEEQQKKPQTPEDKEKARKALEVQKEHQQQIAQWVSSKRFTLMRIPLSSVSPVRSPRDNEFSFTHGPIIVDTDVTADGRGTPIVIDGQHRWNEQQQRGEEYIDAYVGDQVQDHLEDQQRIHVERNERIDELKHEFLNVSNLYPGGALGVLKLMLPPEAVEGLRAERKRLMEKKPEFAVSDEAQPPTADKDDDLTEYKKDTPEEALKAMDEIKGGLENVLKAYQQVSQMYDPEKQPKEGEPPVPHPGEVLAEAFTALGDLYKTSAANRQHWQFIRVIQNLSYNKLLPPIESSVSFSKLKDDPEAQEQYARGAFFGSIYSMSVGLMMNGKSFAPCATEFGRLPGKFENFALALYNPDEHKIYVRSDGVATYWHETGHYVDNMIAEGKNGMSARNTGIGSERLKYASLDDNHPVGQLTKEVSELPEVKKLADEFAKGSVVRYDYLLNRKEVFARLFDQFCYEKLADSDSAGTMKVLGNTPWERNDYGHAFLVDKDRFRSDYMPKLEAILKQGGMMKSLEILLLVVDSLQKSHVRGHYRSTKTGVPAWVRDHARRDPPAGVADIRRWFDTRVVDLDESDLLSDIDENLDESPVSQINSALYQWQKDNTPRADKAFFYHTSPRGNFTSISQKGLLTSEYGKHWHFSDSPEGLFFAFDPTGALYYWRTITKKLADAGMHAELPDIYRVPRDRVWVNEKTQDFVGSSEVNVNHDISPQDIEVYIPHMKEWVRLTTITGEKVKQPHEMTQEEFSAWRYPPLRGKVAAAAEKFIRDEFDRKGIPVNRVEVRGSLALGVETPKSDIDIFVSVPNRYFHDADDLGQKLIEETKIFGRQIDVIVNWSGIGKKGGTVRGSKTHERIIKRAMKEGKEIPKEVLKDYPHLKAA